MIAFYKAALGPLLLLQARWVERTTPRLPEASGPRAGIAGIPRTDAMADRDEHQAPRAAGAAGAAGATTRPLRILFVGDSSAAGVGVDHQDSALAAQSAAFLFERTGMPVQWQLVAKSGVNTREAIDLLKESKLEPADILVTALGVNDVTDQRKPDEFIADYKALVEHVAQTAGARASIVSGLPPLRVLPAAPQPLRWYTGKYAEHLDHSLRQWVEQDESLYYISMQWAATPNEMARDGYHPGAGQYRRWAQLVAESAAKLVQTQLGKP